MRQIKFRAWDKDSKRMHYAEDLIGPGGWVIQFHGVPLEIGMVPSAQRLAHPDMRSSELTMLTARASHCCRTRTRLTSKLAQVLE